MPNYTFENKRTKKQHDKWLSMSELDTYLEKNKNLRQVITSINIVGGVGGITHKTDGGWKDNLSRIAEAHPKSALAARYGKKTIKQSKTEQVIAKHRKRKKW
jgi:hypothetical protein